MKSISQPSPHPFAAIIVAAGSGQRFGGNLPKQYAPLLGRPVLRHTLEAFLRCGAALSELRVVIDPAHEDLYLEAAAGLDLARPIYGGAERKDSVYNALQSLAHLPEDYPLLIHDGARPLVQPDLITAVLDGLTRHKAVTPACPVSDTLRRIDQGLLDDAINRTGLAGLQTPQGFHYGTLLKAHEAARTLSDITDDTGVVSAYGIEVSIVPGSRTNLKITTPEDLTMAAALLSQSTKTVTAMGHDVHALIPGDGTIRLGGIDIPHDKKLLGHSDADVVLHAVTDALLGAIASGDIGTHFPPSDMSFKNMDSAVFLKKAVELVKAQGGNILHVDITVLGEKPKIFPHREKMQSRIAEIIGIPLSSVSIKATTTEGLGFTGREEGIVAQALASVRLPA